MQETLKILVVRFSSIGDIVLTTPVVRMLKKQLNAQVHFLTKSAYVPLLKNNPYIDSVYQIENSITEVIADLKKEKYDYVIDLHNNLRTQILKIRLGVSAKGFNKLNMEKFMLTNFKLYNMPKIHIVDRYLETVKHLGVKNDNQGLDFFLSANDKLDISIFPKNYIVFENVALYWDYVHLVWVFAIICSPLSKSSGPPTSNTGLFTFLIIEIIFSFGNILVACCPPITKTI